MFSLSPQLPGTEGSLCPTCGPEKPPAWPPSTPWRQVGHVEEAQAASLQLPRCGVSGRPSFLSSPARNGVRSPHATPGTTTQSNRPAGGPWQWVAREWLPWPTSLWPIAKAHQRCPRKGDQPGWALLSDQIRRYLQTGLVPEPQDRALQGWAGGVSRGDQLGWEERGGGGGPQGWGGRSIGPQ